jgi:hypothetical protein
LNQLTERLDALVARFEGLGVIRTADDIRVIANELRDIPDDRLEAESNRISVSIDRLSIIHSRLARGGLPRLAGHVEKVLTELRSLLRPSP